MTFVCSFGDPRSLDKGLNPQKSPSNSYSAPHHGYSNHRDNPSKGKTDRWNNNPHSGNWAKDRQVKVIYCCIKFRAFLFVSLCLKCEILYIIHHALNFNVLMKLQLTKYWLRNYNSVLSNLVFF